MDNDGDGLIDLLDGLATAAITHDDCRPPDSIFTSGKDTDSDGYERMRLKSTWAQILYHGAIGGIAPSSTTPSKGWPWDLRGETAFSADRVNVTDLGTFTTGGSFRKNGTAPGKPGFDRRWDLRPGNTIGTNWINVADLAAMATNTPVPMYEIRGFGYAGLCSAHPVYND